MRVLMLTQWFDPEPAFKGLQFARKLKDRGHDVEVLTGFPNYPAGRLYDGYRIRLWQRESIEGVPVVRVPLYPSHDRSIVRRALNYLSFALSAAVLGPLLMRRPDVIYAYQPPGTVAIPALVLKAWFSSPVVYDVQDLWPDTITSSGMMRRGIVIRMLDLFCRFAYRQMDRIVVLSPGFSKRLKERGVAADRLDVIYNWAPEPPHGAACSTSGSDEFTVVFAGTMGPAQDLDTVLGAAARLLGGNLRITLRMVGGGIDFERLRTRAEEMGLSNVQFQAWEAADSVRRILLEADALLVHLKDDPLFAITVPSKTQAYLAAGRPIVMAVRGDAADLGTEAGACVLAQPGNPESLANAIVRLAQVPQTERDRMGRRGREFYEKHLSMAVGVTRFEGVFESAVREHAGVEVQTERVSS